MDKEKIIHDLAMSLAYQKLSSYIDKHSDIDDIERADLMLKEYRNFCAVLSEIYNNVC